MISCGDVGGDNLWWWWWWLSNLLKSDLHGVLMLRSTGSVRCPQLATHLKKIFWGFFSGHDCLKSSHQAFFQSEEVSVGPLWGGPGRQVLDVCRKVDLRIRSLFCILFKKNDDRLSFLIYQHRRCSSSHYSLRDIHSSHPLHPKFCSETHQPIPIAF